MTHCINSTCVWAGAPTGADHRRRDRRDGSVRAGWRSPEARLVTARVALPSVPALARPLRIAYSDWPGWTAFEIAIQKGWFKEEQVDVRFAWLDYLPSLDAFGAGKVDAVTVTNGDVLVMEATGAASQMILITDYSNGNDQIIARPGIATFKQPLGTGCAWSPTAMPSDRSGRLAPEDLAVGVSAET
jgi:ABC-type nitrate/sulfonate/bicarbonate transport system substrate-binding protein